MNGMALCSFLQVFAQTGGVAFVSGMEFQDVRAEFVDELRLARAGRSHQTADARKRRSTVFGITFEPFVRIIIIIIIVVMMIIPFLQPLLEFFTNVWLNRARQMLWVRPRG